MKALEGTQSALGLDYGGIDFGLNAAGEVLVFEANATMVVNPPEAEERWDYRRPAYGRILAAILRMFRERASLRDAASGWQPTRCVSRQALVPCGGREWE